MTDIDLMIRLEGCEHIAYDCPAGFRTVGIGFNMDNPNATKVWYKLEIKEDFDLVYYKKERLSDESIKKLFNHVWSWCKKEAKKRANELGLDYDSMPVYKKFVLADIAYNTGGIKNWKYVFLKETPREVLFEARRKPKKLMDNRVAKIGFYFDLIKDLDEAKEIGLVYARVLR